MSRLWRRAQRRTAGKAPKGEIGGRIMTSIAQEKRQKRTQHKPAVPVHCAFCRGTGVHDGTCQVCGGKGYRQLHQPTAPCASCRGTGRQIRGSTLTCASCRGLGTVEVDADAVPCPDCGGSGRATNGDWPGSALSCSRCGGTGRIDRAKLRPNDPSPAAHRRSRGRCRAAGTGVREITLEY